MSDHKKEIDQVTGVETTGHEWDGLKELNNPAPRWWIIVWVITIIWGIGYWIVYPAWPTLSGSTKGTLGWTKYKELEESQAEIIARQNEYLGDFQKTTDDQVLNDPKLYAFAKAGGAALFKTNCVMCHGSGAQGAVGFPNLTDDDWLWGGTIADIEQTLHYGIRSGHEKARQSQMPSFGRDELLSKQEIEEVVDYVLSLSSDKGADAKSKGAEIFANNCASCHGEKGTGGREFGAPNLTDAIWLYGGTKEDVYKTVFYAHAGVMPFWQGKLSEDAIRQLAIYVHSLGGGEGKGAIKVEAEENVVPAGAPGAPEEAELPAQPAAGTLGSESAAPPAEASAPTPDPEGVINRQEPAKDSTLAPETPEVKKEAEKTVNESKR